MGWDLYVYRSRWPCVILWELALITVGMGGAATGSRMVGVLFIHNVQDVPRRWSFQISISYNETA